MEYIEYGDLGEYIKTPAAKKDAKMITRQILEGLKVLHEEGICHRDLKPQVQPPEYAFFFLCQTSSVYPRVPMSHGVHTI